MILHKNRFKKLILF